MLKIVLRRIGSILPILLGVSIITFLLMKLVPGDMTLTLLGPFATEETIAQVRIQYGLDKPVWIQYLKWLMNVLSGDFGRSIAYQVPVAGLVGARIVNTLILTFSAAIFAILFGFLGGIVAAAKRFSILDRTVTLLAVILASAPTFWFGILLLHIFVLRLHWFPAIGMYSIGKEGEFWNLMWHIPLPAISASLISLAVILRLTRSGLLDVLGQDYIRAAEARGLPRRKIIYLHAVRSIVPSVVNICGLQVGFIFSAALFAEVIFQWPGLGLLMYNSILARDVPVIQAVLLVIAFVFVIVNFISDITIVVLNPQSR